MESRALLAFILSVAILVGYQFLFAPVSPRRLASQGDVAGHREAEPAAKDLPSVRQLPAKPAAAVPSADPAVSAETAGQDQRSEVRTEHYQAVFTSLGGRLRSFELLDYREGPDPHSPHLEMVASQSVLPLGIYWTTAEGAVVDDSAVRYELRRRSAGNRDQDVTEIIMTGVSQSGERITKTLSLHAHSYLIDYHVDIESQSQPSIGVAWARKVRPGGGRFSGKEGPVVLVDGSLKATSAASLKKPVSHNGVISWGGYADHYFLAAYYPDKPAAMRFEAMATRGTSQGILWADDTDGAVAYHLYVGPKQMQVLKLLGHQLDEAVALGWFAVIARPMLDLLIFLHSFTGNYGWSIIVLTIGIRIVFYPVNKKQAMATKAMQRIQPELKKIQEKYKDDRERLNKEMMELYRRHKVNPLSGCLPMLIQLPVFLGLYNALMQAIELRHEPFLGWIVDLSQPDRLGSFPLPFVSPPGIPVLTLLMGASMVVQQRMTPPAGDPTQQKMMMFLPIVFTVMFVNFPSGLVIYWFANNVLSILQQYMTNRAKA